VTLCREKAPAGVIAGKRRRDEGTKRLRDLQKQKQVHWEQSKGKIGLRPSGSEDMSFAELGSFSSGVLSSVATP
jgi:hypothetical protein